jgi:MFS superfamily sulfate permease-like transporter
MTRQEQGDRGRSPFRPPARRPLLARLVPVSERLRGYGGDTLRRDLLAGVTVAALALPAAMAYGELAGLTAVAGLYTLLLPAVAYTVLGSSRQLIVGPEGSIAAMVAAAVVPLAADDPRRAAALASLLALLVGAVYLVARLVRLGWVADYFSQAVLLGYLHGVAVVLVIGQLGKLVGITPEAEGPLPTLADVLRRIGQFHGPTVAVGAVCLAVLLVLRWRLRRFPGPLVVVVAAIVASAALDLAADGVAVVGDIPSGLPSVTLPDAGLGDGLTLLPAALGIFFVSYSDEILTARAFAGDRGEHVRADTELGAMGAASLAAGITQGFPVGASGSRTAVNDQMGVRSQLSGLLSAAVIALVLLFLTAPWSTCPRRPWARSSWPPGSAS